MFRMVALLPALAVAVVLGEDVSEGIVLLQSSVLVQHRTLPEVVPLLDSSRAILNEIQKHVTDLEDHLNDTQSQEKQMIEGLKDKLEANLTAQDDLNNRTATDNANLKADIDGLNKDIMNLRARSTSLKKYNGNLVSDFNALKDNITTVAEFTMQAITKSEEMLGSAPELVVLSDLAQKDAKASQDREHTNHLKAIAKAKQVSLLQTDTVIDAQTDNIIKGHRSKGHSAKVKGKFDVVTDSQTDSQTDMQTDSQTDMQTAVSYSSVLSQTSLQGMLVPDADRVASGFLEMVNSALLRLTVEHNASASAMVAQFDSEYQQGSQLYAELLDDQAQLNSISQPVLQLD